MFVHGFSETYQRITSYLNHLGDQIRMNHVYRFGFVWPSQSVSYFRARFFAEEAAKRLRKALDLLVSRGNKVVLVCHSMGCRVGCHALYKSKSHVEHLFLVGAGIASDSLNSDGNFPAEKLSARKVTVLFSRRDGLLKNNFPFAELLPGLWNFRPRAATEALGALGLAQGPRSHKVQQRDCSDQVFGHSTHFYLNSATAVDSIKASLEDCSATPQAKM